jgi:DNA polymerase I-like protein with 3'-5' exonuclease and polymerase domains
MSRSHATKEQIAFDFSGLSYTNPEFFPFWEFSEVAFDIETYDPELKQYGPGVRRGKADLVGVALRTRTGRGGYYAFGHEGFSGNNPKGILRWLREGFAKFRGSLIGANLLYDTDFVQVLGVRFHPDMRFRDVQFAAALLDENADSYSLDTLLKRYANTEKQKDLLFDKYGPGFINMMDKIHPADAAIYALGDVDPLFKLHDELCYRLKEDTEVAPSSYALPLYDRDKRSRIDLYDLECRLFPLLLSMRENGVHVDIEHAKTLAEEYDRDTELALGEIAAAGFRDFPRSCPTSVIALILSQRGFEIPKTLSGRDSIRQQWLEQHKDKDPLIKAFLRIRRNEKFVGTFLNSYVLGHGASGKIHCLFHPLRSDAYGTVSGRFSSSHPNLQNIPARDPVLGPACRALFVPGDGRQWWSKDYSQIEYRFLVHYAYEMCMGDEKKSAKAAVDAYRASTDCDFHKVAAELTGVDRKAAKNINFGVAYGMGAGKMSRSLGLSPEDGERMLASFHHRMPFLKETARLTNAFAEKQGFITTILGRKRRFDEYEYVVYNDDGTRERIAGPDPAEVAKRADVPEYRVRRAYTYKALNALLQGGAADMMKKAMVDAWEAKLFDNTGVTCTLTVHDELNGTTDGSAQATEALAELDRVMSNAIPLNVPVYADGGVGANWKEAKG